MTTLQQNRELLLILLALLFFTLTKHWEEGIGISSITYGAMVRDILSTGDFLTYKLAPGFFDPFVGHPPLVLWLDSLVFMVFGDAPQNMRIVSIISTLAIFFSVFKIAHHLFDKKTAVLSALMMLFIPKLMNFSTSGWLDMPMLAFTLLGYYSFFCLKGYKKAIFSGLFLAAAFLSKGFSAIGIIPLGLYFVFAKKTSLKEKGLFLLFSFGPLIFFTLAYYLKSSHIFWLEYARDELNIDHQFSSTKKDPFWYLKGLLKHGHLITLLGLTGLFSSFRQKNLLSLFALAVLSLHFIAYSMSSRHYDQYLIPCFPWMALFTALQVQSFIKNINPLKVSKAILSLSIVFFTVAGFTSIQIHGHAGKHIQGFQSVMPEEEELYFIGEQDKQITWEFMSSFIVWYFNKRPRLITLEKYKEDLKKTLSYSLILSQNYFPEIDLSAQKSVEICGHNQHYKLLVPMGKCQQNLFISDQQK